MPEEMLSSADSNEESLETVSLLQVSLEQSVKSHLEQNATSNLDQNASWNRVPRVAHQTLSLKLKEVLPQSLPIGTKPVKLPERVAGDTDLYCFSPSTTNAVTSLMLLLVIACIVCKPGYLGHVAKTRDSCPAWVMLTVVLSYISWLAGFFMFNTSYFMSGLYMGQDTIMSVDVETQQPGVFKESPYFLIKSLIKADHCVGEYCTASRVAGWSYLILSVVDPLIKLLLMIVGEVFRRRPEKVQIARNCLIAGRILSKWASAMYFFLLVWHCQFLLMDHAPVLTTRAVLDIGWVGFTLFCVTSVVSAVSIPLPHIPTPESRREKSGLSDLARLVVLLFVGLASVMYFVLILDGISTDLVKLNTEKYKQSGFDPSMDKALATSTSIVGCMSVMLSRFFTSGQVIPLVAFFVIAGLVIAMALADMSFLALAAWAMYKGHKGEFEYWISWSRITRHCAAVDVLVVGVLLANLSKALVIERGVQLLLYAEVLRYVVVYLIMENVAKHVTHDSSLSSLGTKKQGALTNDALKKNIL